MLGGKPPLTKESMDITREFIIINGNSGTGKTTLAYKLEEPTKLCGGFFVSGKFDIQRSSSEPFTAFTMAFKKICEEIYNLKSTNKARFDDFKLRIKKAVGGSEGGNALISIIPNLNLILNDGKKNKDDRYSTNHNIYDQKSHNNTVSRNSVSYHSEVHQQGPNLKNKINYLLRRFVRAICCQRSLPLVLLIDDLQWADIASLNLIESLLTDKLNKGLLLIGCYRDNELRHVNCFDSENHPLLTWLQRMDRLNARSSDINKSKKYEEEKFEEKEFEENEDSICSINNERKRDYSWNITKIQVSNLSVQSINEFLEDLLTSNISDTAELAVVVYNRTSGNIFFIIEFLKSLRDRNLLTYNFGLTKWTWDINKIKSNTNVTDNVAIFLREKMIKLLTNNDSKDTLTIAGCLGYSFESSTLIMVASKLKKCKKEGERIISNIHQTLRICIKEGILETGFSGNGDCDRIILCSESAERDHSLLSHSYRFVHDQIHHAALSLISEDELDTLRTRIGNILVENMSEEELEKNIFIAVNLLNNKGEICHKNDASSSSSSSSSTPISSSTVETKAGNSTTATTAVHSDTEETLLNNTTNETDSDICDDDDEHSFDVTRLVQLNLKAGKKAMESSAFNLSSVYLRNGIRLLDNSTANFRNGLGETLSNNLFSIAAQAEYCNGNFRQMGRYLNVVLKRDETPIEEKFDAISTLLEGLRAQEHYQEATDQSLNVLSKLGVTFPKRNLKSAVIQSFLRTKLMLKGKQNRDTIMNLPPMKDKNQIMSMRIMDGLSSCAFFSSPDLLPLVIFKMVRWCIKFGICHYAPAAFSVYALVLCTMQDFKGGNYYGNLAIELATKRLAHVKEIQSRVILIYHSFVAHWIEPLLASSTPLLNGYQIGMETGDMESAMWNISGYLWCSLNSGRSLHLVDKDMRMYVDEMRHYKQNSTLTSTLVNWQFILCLIGNVDDPVALTGEAIDYVKFAKHLQEKKNNTLLDYTSVIRLMLAYYHDKFELAWDLVGKGRGFEKSNPSHLFLWRKLMFQGLTAYALARTNKSSGTKLKSRTARRWMLRGQQIQKRMKKWISIGNANCVHVVQLLQAEELALLGKKEEAFQKYKASIAASSRAGFIHDKALANERVGEFFCSLSVDDVSKNQAAFHLQTAHQLYFDWGAEGKADQLFQKHYDLLSNFQERKEGTKKRSSL